MSLLQTLERSPGFPRIDEGYRVLASLSIAIPVWKVTVACRLQEQKSLPIFSEFVMKSIGAEVGDPEDVSSFLDLPIDLILDVMAELYKSGHISPTNRGPKGDVSYRLTSDGLRVLDQLSETKPVQREVAFHVDSLTGTISRFNRAQLLTGRQAEAAGLLALPSVPSTIPEIKPSDESELSRAFQENPQGKGLTLLSVVEQVGVAEKLFLRGDLIVSEQADGSAGLDARVFVDGRLSDERSLAFLEKDLLGLLRAVKVLDSDRSRLISIAENVGASVVEKNSIDSLVEKSRLASRGLSFAAPDEQVGDETDEPTKVTDLTAALARVDDFLYSGSSRWTHVAEHMVFLERAFSNASRDLVIGLPSFSRPFWNNELKPLVISSLASGVKVSFVLAPYELNPAHFTFDKEHFAEVKEEMEALGCDVTESDVAELATLIVDSSWAALSSESWGSSPGHSIGRVFLGRGIYLPHSESAKRIRAVYVPG